MADRTLVKTADDTGGALTSLSMALEGAALAQMKLVKNSRSCLESQYWQHMRARLAEHGQPLNLPVRQVVDLYRQQTEGSHWGHPAWATVYLGFRSGQYEAALQSADEAAGVVPPVVREEIRRYVQTANRQAFEASEALGPTGGTSRTGGPTTLTWAPTPSRSPSTSS